MSSAARYVFVVSMDVAPDKEDLFNEVYDTEHVPYLMAVPGVLGVRRAKAETFRVAMAGRVDDKSAASPAYIALYELESADVIASDAWAAAVEKGRWAEAVRPHTSNRQHAIYRLR